MRHRRKWAPEEDEILRREASLQMEKGQLKQWNVVATSLPGRTNKDCRKRWAKLGSNINKGAWAAEEDEKLQAAVQELGCRWTEVAKRVVTRHAEQCAKRWQNSLDPTVDHTKWGEDDDKLLGCVQVCGRNWTTIREKYFPNRSGTDLKNRYTMLTRKQERAAEANRCAIERASQNNDDEAADAMDDDDDDEDDDDTSENDNGSESFPVESQALIAQDPYSGVPNQGESFQFRDSIPNYDSGFFPPCNTSANDLAWFFPVPMGEYLPAGNHQLESESSSSVHPTPPFLEDPTQSDIDMLESGGSLGELLHTDSDPSWVEISGPLTHATPSALPSQTTLILENVHPDALKSVMSILIETNTKMSMQRHR